MFAAPIHFTPQPQYIDLRPEVLVPIEKVQFPDRTAEVARQREEARLAEEARLEAQRVAQEAETARLAQQTAPAPIVRPAASPAVVAPTGNCADWIRAAGITDMANAMELIRRESGCNPNAVNPSSGACGIGQQLPCGKWPHAWNDPIGGLIDMNVYTLNRYGSWANAVAFHSRMGWY